MNEIRVLNTKNSFILCQMFIFPYEYTKLSNKDTRLLILEVIRVVQDMYYIPGIVTREKCFDFWGK